MTDVVPAGATRIDLTDQARALVRLSQAVNTYQGNGIFSPGQPLTPSNGEDSPRLFEYQPGVNLMITPRMGFGALLSFPALRGLASVKEVRLNIELIKRQICGMEWDIVPVETSTAVTVDDTEYVRTFETDSIKQFFEKPDGVNEWDSWLKMLLEDMLVIDAVTIYPDMKFGKLRSLDIIDGATMRPLLDTRGRIPLPPMPAFTQVLYGIPSTWYAADRIIYKPLNAKSHTVYGESPTEWVLTAINTAIRKDAQRIGAFTDGNIPGAIVFVDVQTPEQKAIIEEYTDAIMKGDIARANKLLFLPSGTGSNVFPFAQNDIDNTAIDEYLFKVACWAFGNSPSEFGLIPGAGGLGGAGFMKGAENTQYRSMIDPISGYVAQLINRVIREFMFRRDVKFQWKNGDPQEDKLQQVQVDQGYINAGVYGPDYVQDRLGISEKYRQSAKTAAPSPLPFGQGGAVPLPHSMLSYVKRAIKADLTVWRDRAGREISKPTGKIDPYFMQSDVIPAELAKEISAELRKASTRDEVETIFNNLLGEGFQKTITQIVEDPLTHVKAGAEKEMERTLIEYFSELKQRVLQNAIA
ncbi:MAG: hypothetical protein NTW69_06340 [Chloroflexi bacterium]|nr:hypothetical protein [Chloroflexota bacterium]